MGKWRKYSIGAYRLQQLKGQAVATWRDSAGTRHRVRLGHYSSEDEARRALAAFAGRHALINVAGATLTVEDVVAAYIEDRARDGKGTTVMRADWRALQPVFGQLLPRAVTAEICRQYASLRLERVSPSTVWTELTRLRSAFNWGVKTKLLPVSEVGYVWTPAKPAGRTRVLTESEIDSLLQHCIMPHIRLFVILALCTGGRSAALLELQWSKVDFELGVINLKRTEAPNPLLKKVRKGRAIVPMSDVARAALSEARQGALSDYVIEWNGAPVKSIKTGFNSACKRAGLKGVTPHTLRHTVATALDNAGIETRHISRFLGHSSMLSTAIYTHPDPATLRPAADVLPLKKVR